MRWRVRPRRPRSESACACRTGPLAAPSMPRADGLARLALHDRRRDLRARLRGPASRPGGRRLRRGDRARGTPARRRPRPPARAPRRDEGQPAGARPTGLDAARRGLRPRARRETPRASCSRACSAWTRARRRSPSPRCSTTRWPSSHSCGCRAAAPRARERLRTFLDEFTVLTSVGVLVSHYVAMPKVAAGSADVVDPAPPRGRRPGAHGRRDAAAAARDVRAPRGGPRPRGGHDRRAPPQRPLALARAAGRPRRGGALRPALARGATWPTWRRRSVSSPRSEATRSAVRRFRTRTSGSIPCRT